jgi:hypothetical protein
MTRRTIAAWAIGAVLGYLAFLGLMDFVRISRLRNRGVVTAAHVLSESGRLRHGETYFVYRFDVNGKPFRGSRRWYMAPSGDFQVTYLPEEPSVNAPGTGSELTPESSSFVFVALFGFYLFCVSRVRRDGPGSEIRL